MNFARLGQVRALYSKLELDPALEKNTLTDYYLKRFGLLDLKSLV